MSKLVLLLFLGICVMAVHMAPADDGAKDPDSPEALEKQAEQLREIVNSKGPEIEAVVRKNDTSFNWDSWWSEAVPILKIVGKIVPPNKANKKQLCNEDKDADDEYRKLYGPKIEEQVRKTVNSNFNYEQWWSKAKNILEVAGDVVSPLAKKAEDYCKENGKPKPGA